MSDHTNQRRRVHCQKLTDFEVSLSHRASDKLSMVGIGRFFTEKYHAREHIQIYDVIRFLSYQ